MLAFARDSVDVNNIYRAIDALMRFVWPRCYWRCAKT